MISSALERLLMVVPAAFSCCLPLSYAVATLPILGCGRASYSLTSFWSGAFAAFMDVAAWVIGSRFSDPSSVVSGVLTSVPSVELSCGMDSVVSACTMRVMPRTVVMSLPYTGMWDASVHSLPFVICSAVAVSDCSCGSTALMESTVSLLMPDAPEPESPFRPDISEIAFSSWALTSMACL